MKKLIPALMIVVTLFVLTNISVNAEELRGYDKKDGGYQYVSFGSFSYYEDGTEAPILWRVLSVQNGEGFLLTEYIIDVHYVHLNTKKYYDFKTWKNCDLYNYLQDEFLPRAFSENEASALLQRTEDGALVTLPKIDDIRNKAFGFDSDKSRLCTGTPYAKKIGLYLYGDKTSPWISREKSKDRPMQQRRVMLDGKLGTVPCGNVDLGIRPCIYLDLSKLTVSGGSGTKDDPFVLSAGIQEAPNDGNPISNDSTEELDIRTEENDTDNQNNSGDAVEKDKEAVISAENNIERIVFTAAAEPSGIHSLFPSLTEEGFLPEGKEEFVLEDPDNGLWLYCSQSLRIEITRKSEINHEKKPVNWYEAQIYTRDNSELFDLFAFDEEKYTNIYRLALPEEMAKQHHLVFAINSDYFIYRVTRDKEESYTYPIGTELRNGKIMYTQTRSSKSYVYPTLDVLALYPDGNMKVFPNKLLYNSNYKNASIEFNGAAYSFEYKKGDKQNAREKAEAAMAEKLLEDGATDTLCFGPILIQDGEKTDTSEWGESSNPRTGIGMVEKGHYVCIVVDGRKAGVSEGENCIWLQEKFYDLGCQLAFNLDGGATSAMMFMGKQISVAGNYANGLTKRGQNELLGIGISDLVQ